MSWDEDFFGEDEAAFTSLEKPELLDDAESTMEIIEETIKELNLSGIQGYLSRRVVTAEALLEAPRGFFDEFTGELERVTDVIKLAIADKGLAEFTQNAAREPSNLDVLEETYRNISTVVLSALNNTPFTGTKRQIFIQLVLDEIMGLSVVDPLYREPLVTEIIVNGPKDVQVEIDGKLYYVPGCEFRDQRHLQNLFERIFSPLNKQVSRTTPQIKGRLSDFSRVYANDISICPTGPTLNIRRHKDAYVKPQQLVDWGAMSEEIAEDLGNLIYNGASFLVIGGTGSGKTTLLSSLTGFIPNDQSILTLEDNLEMKPCPHKMLRQPMETLSARKDQPGDLGVSMRDLVKGSLQMRPDWIIVGEVTDGACYDMVQALATGHSGGSTLHSDSAEAGIGRLISLVSQGGVMSGSSDAMPLIGAAVDLIIIVERFPLDGSRKITHIAEVPPLPSRNEFNELEMKLTPLWDFVDDGVSDDGKVLGHWEKRNNISDFLSHKLHLRLATRKSWAELKALSESREEF